MWCFYSSLGFSVGPINIKSSFQHFRTVLVRWHKWWHSHSVPTISIIKSGIQGITVLPINCFHLNPWHALLPSEPSVQLFFNWLFKRGIKDDFRPLGTWLSPWTERYFIGPFLVGRGGQVYLFLRMWQPSECWAVFRKLLVLLLGHTWSSSHAQLEAKPKRPSNSIQCLTMYAYAEWGTVFRVFI